MSESGYEDTVWCTESLILCYNGSATDLPPPGPSRHLLLHHDDVSRLAEISMLQQHVISCGAIVAV